MRGGVRKYFQFGPNRKQAEQQFAKLQIKLASGSESLIAQATSQVIRDNGSKDIRVEEIAYKHLEWVKANRAEHTYLLREYFIGRFLQFISPCMVSAIDFQKVESFRAWVAKNGNGGNEALRHVKTMLRWADDFDWCPMPLRRFPKIQASRPPTRNFTPQEITSLLAAAEPDFRDMLVFGMMTGLRPQELRQLTRDNLLQLPDGDCCIRIERHKTAKQTAEPKPRSLPLCKEALEIIHRQLAAHEHSNHVFLNLKYGEPYTASAFRQRLTRLCEKIGMKKSKPPYGLRHTFGTDEGASNVNQSVLAQLMGHSRLQTTDRYIANVDEAHKKAIAAIGKRISAFLPNSVKAEVVEPK
jgi:integrase